MMRPAVQYDLRLGLSALAVVLAVVLVVLAGACVVVGVELVVVVSGVVETADGRSTYFGASAGWLAWVACGAAVVVACNASGTSAEATVNPREPAAWADTEARTMAATRKILRMCVSPVFGVTSH